MNNDGAEMSYQSRAVIEGDATGHDRKPLKCAREMRQTKANKSSPLMCFFSGELFSFLLPNFHSLFHSHIFEQSK